VGLGTSAFGTPADYYGFCWLLAPSGVATARRPFRHKARSPQVRTMAFPAQPPDLRRFASVVRASRSSARSPCSAAPPIRFLFVGSTGSLPRFFQRSPHGIAPCGSLRSLRPSSGRTLTSGPSPMLGTPIRALWSPGDQSALSWAVNSRLS